MESITSQPVLDLDTNEVKFVGPYDGNAINAIINMRNNHPYYMAFKVKTTAPRRYCVRPNSGIIDPFASVQLTINLQSYNLVSDDVSRHKFMIQTTFVPSANLDIADVFADKSQLVAEKKLKCVFDNFEHEGNEFGDSVILPGGDNYGLSTTTRSAGDKETFAQTIKAATPVSATHDLISMEEPLAPTVVSQSLSGFAGLNDDQNLRERKVSEKVADERKPSDSKVKEIVSTTLHSSGYCKPITTDRKVDAGELVDNPILQGEAKRSKEILKEYSIVEGDDLIDRQLIDQSDSSVYMSPLLITCLIGVSFLFGLGLYRILAALNIME